MKCACGDVLCVNRILISRPEMWIIHNKTKEGYLIYVNRKQLLGLIWECVKAII